jgi:flagellar hook-length control protein FliK
MPLANFEDMNATPVVLPQSVPLNASPTGSIGAPAATESAKATSGGPTFAGALNDAGAKPARKPAAVKLSEATQSGAGLPVPGNPAPPAAAAPIATVIAASVAASDDSDAPGVAIGSPASGAKQGSGPAETAAAAAAPKDASAVSSSPAGTFSSLVGPPGAEPLTAASPAPVSSAVATAVPVTPGVPAESVNTTVIKAPNPPAVHSTAKVALRGSGTTAVSGVASGKGSDEEPDGSSAAATAAGPAQATSGAGAAASLDEAGATTAAAMAAGQAGNAASHSESNSDDSNMAAPSASVSLSAAEAAGASSTSLASAGLKPLVAGSSNAASAITTPPVVVDGDKHLQAEASVAPLAGGSGDAAAGLSQLGSSSVLNGTTAAASTPTLQVHASLDSSDFAQGLADRVSWMIGSGANSAKLQVNPPQLGPIELSISVQGNHALVAMTTHSAVTRDVLESSSPKLREMLSAQGFGQVSVDISQRSFQDHSAYSRPYGQVPSTDRSAAATTAVTAVASSTPRASLGALDAYA